MHSRRFCAAHSASASANVACAGQAMLDAGRGLDARPHFGKHASASHTEMADEPSALQQRTPASAPSSGTQTASSVPSRTIS